MILIHFPDRVDRAVYYGLIARKRLGIGSLIIFLRYGDIRLVDYIKSQYRGFVFEIFGYSPPYYNKPITSAGGCEKASRAYICFAGRVMHI
jgi:hypothetical protein